MMQAGLGNAIGKAYIPGRGVGIVFATETPNLFRVQLGDGTRYLKSRGQFTWTR